ncbi:winged helix-turn-helix transcriptional regulator [Sphingomonas sp.]|uniref:winged helix-turn-helix transcriptional regulator n=1 Tax=Sphingomonas sp. TaxID=28214 RepID=UPI003B39FDFB
MLPEHMDVTADDAAFARSRALLAEVEQPRCRSIAPILQRVGDKWSILIVMLLAGGPRRFNELKRMIDGISQRMLTLNLRGLERDGLVSRTVFPTIPPRVDYELTALGKSLCQPIIALGQWADTHYDTITQSRAAFDAKAEE